MERRLTGIAAANGCAVRSDWHEGYPAVVNDPAMADHVANVARAVAGRDRFIQADRPSMGSEDFAFYLEKVPGCFFLIGACPSDREAYPPLHSDQFDFWDPCLAVGMNMFIEIVKQFRI